MDLLKQDKALKEYRSAYNKNKLTLMDEIEDIKGRFDYASLKQYNTDLRRFKSETTKAIQLGILTPYQSYMAKKWLLKSRIKNRDMLLWYLVYKYAYFNYLMKEVEQKVFYEVNKHFVDETEKQCQKLTGKDYKIDYEKLTDEAMQEPNNLGYVWNIYKDSTTDFNANEMYNTIIMEYKGEKKSIKETIDRQENRIVNPKLKGTLDNQIDFITSYSQMQIFYKYGVEIVKVMGVLDEKTCEICDEYIGKEYPIDKIVIGKQVSSHINCRCYLEPVK